MPVANWKRATSGRATAACTTLVPPLQLSYHSKIWSSGFEKSQERICISFFPPEGDPAIHRPLHRPVSRYQAKLDVPTWQELGKKPASLWPRWELQESSTPSGPSQPLTWSNEMTWTSSNNIPGCSVPGWKEVRVSEQLWLDTLIWIKRCAPKNVHFVYNWLGKRRSSRFHAKSETGRSYN